MICIGPSRKADWWMKDVLDAVYNDGPVRVAVQANDTFDAQQIGAMGLAQ